MSTDGPQKLGNVLQEVIDRLGVREKIDEAQVIETWASVAGPQVNSVTESAWMKGDTLFIKISSSAWRQELHMNRRAWKKRLNDAIGRKVVDEILFR